MMISICKNINSPMFKNFCEQRLCSQKILKIGLFMFLHVSLVSYYRKNSKIWDTSNNCHNCPKIGKVWCNIALMHSKEADAMANSVDPDQTASSEAVWSWSALFAETYLSQYIEFLRYYFEHEYCANNDVACCLTQTCRTGWIHKFAGTSLLLL